MKTRNSTRRFFNRPLGRSPFAPPPVHVPRWLWVVVGAWVLWVAVFPDSWHPIRLESPTYSAHFTIIVCGFPNLLFCGNFAATVVMSCEYSTYSGARL